MGLAASQARLLMLTGRSSDLEFKCENLAQQRMDIADQVTSLLNQEEGPSTENNNNGSNGLNPQDILKTATGVASSIVGSLFGPIGESVSNTLSGVINSIGGLFGGSNNSSGASSETSDSKKEDIQKQLAALQEQDKKLEMQLKQADTQHQAVQTETESVQKTIDKNIESTFKILS